FGDNSKSGQDRPIGSARRIAANRQAAGAFAEALIAVSFIRLVFGRWTHHHATTCSTRPVFCSHGRTCSHRLHSHAEAERKVTNFAGNGAGRTSARLFPTRGMRAVPTRLHGR